jgi:hypothetical protein
LHFAVAGEEAAIRQRFQLLTSHQVFDERARRLWAAAEASTAGYGGIASVVRATGISESTVRRGIEELGRCGPFPRVRIRRHAGRTPIAEREPGLLEALERLLGAEDGVPDPTLRWTTRSAAELAAVLRSRGHNAADRTILRVLAASGYAVRSKETTGGASRAERARTFRRIHDLVRGALAASNPVVSVDVRRLLVARSHELNNSVSRGPAGSRSRHPDERVALVGGVLAPTTGALWCAARITPDLADVALRTVYDWWNESGMRVYPGATTLTVVTGWNSDPAQLFDWADEFQRTLRAGGSLAAVVSPLPRGIWKWTTVRRRRFRFVPPQRAGDTPFVHAVTVSEIGPAITLDTNARSDPQPRPC